MSGAEVFKTHAGSSGVHLPFGLIGVECLDRATIGCVGTSMTGRGTARVFHPDQVSDRLHI